MINMAKIKLMALMSNIDTEAMAKDADTKYVSVDFAAVQYNVTVQLLQESWSFTIENEDMHLSIKINHCFRQISPDIHMYIYGEEIKHDDKDYTLLELLCYHIEYTIFRCAAKKYPKHLQQKTVKTIGPKILVREFLALTPKMKKPVWIKIYNPTTDLSKINSQCTKILASKKYKDYEAVKNNNGTIQIREHYEAV